MATHDETKANEAIVADFLLAAVVARNPPMGKPSLRVNLYETRFRFHFLTWHETTTRAVVDAMRDLGVVVDRSFMPTRNQRQKGYTITKGRLSKRFVRAVLSKESAS